MYVLINSSLMLCKYIIIIILSVSAHRKLWSGFEEGRTAATHIHKRRARPKSPSTQEIIGAVSATARAEWGWSWLRRFASYRPDVTLKHKKIFIKSYDIIILLLYNKWQSNNHLPNVAKLLVNQSWHGSFIVVCSVIWN